MTVNFYTDNPQKAPTVANFLFSINYAEMMVGQNVDHSGKRYLVNLLQWNDETNQILNAFVWQYPAK